MQNQEKTIIHRHNLQSENFAHYSEKENQVETKSGGVFLFHETIFDSLQFIQCDYSLNHNEQIHIDIEKEVLEMHFRVSGASCIQRSGKPIDLTHGNNMLTYQKDNKQEILMCPVKDGSFFEIRIGISHFEKLMNDFTTHTPNMYRGDAMAITPTMYGILAQIVNNPYSTKMKALFLEAKMTELFLLQMQQNIDQKQHTSFSYGQRDRDRIHETKEIIGQHINEFLTISKLAQLSGMNRRKLMQGFKELFGTTIHVYITEMKMEEARRLLLEEDKYVNEVADYIGYKNPQHFISAFKKKFGISPGKLKNRSDTSSSSM
ncbi:AraC family transcriptional regulator [Sphingobacterium faecium]|uniref:helix-turn-helix transcriptional regulator n=1 Tax=Sphingobacterium faecium TaxID=34087 RepID=UPI00320B5DF6